MSSQTEFITKDKTDVTIDIDIQQDAGAANPGNPLTGLVFNSGGLTARYRRGGTGAVSTLTLVTQTVTGAHSDGGFVELDSTNMPGRYRLDLSDAIIATGVDKVSITLYGAADMAPHTINVVLTSVDWQDVVRAGMTSLPNAAIGANGALGTVDSNNRIAGVQGTLNTLDDLDTAQDTQHGTTQSAVSGVAGDVTTLLSRITSTLFSGITSLAEWLGLIAGSQVGDTTARNELRATGAGSGTYDETTDSQESIRNNQLTTAQVNSEADQALVDAGVTSTRMGYVDNLNVGGSVASSTEVTAIQNNTRVVITLPPNLERPDAGSVNYRVWLYLYDSNGNMEAPDSLPTVSAENNTGVDRSTGLSAVSNSSTGIYFVDYSLASTDAIEGLVFKFNVVEGGITREWARSAQVVDTTAVDFTSADRSKLDELHDNRLTAARAGYLDNINGHVAQTGDSFARLGAPSGVSIAADILTIINDLANGVDGLGALKAVIDAILVDTDTTIPGLITALNNISTSQVNAEVDAALADYDPPTNTELTAVQTAILNKLLAFVQVIVRSDAAIATDNATEITEINADGGSGAGDYANTSESLEAIRDRGDVAYLTATGFSTHNAADVRTEMDSNSTQLAAIVADTNELQTDDLPGLIAALNNISTAQVNAEVDAALADYDPPTRSELTSDINSIISILRGMSMVNGTIGATGNDTTHLHLTGLTYGDDEINDLLLVIFDNSSNEYHSRWVTDWVNTTALATVSELPFTPEDSVDTYWILSIRKDSGLTAAQVNAEVDTALSDYDGPTRTEATADKDEIITEVNNNETKIDTIGSNVDSILIDTGTTLENHLTDIKGSTFNGTTDSLEAIRDRGDAAWTTGGGGSIADILAITPLIPNAIDLADTAIWRVGLMLTNMLDDLPSTTEITPGTISIDRKAIGETTWTAIVTDAACSELAGMIYYDEVFDSATGYAAGDSIRVTFKSQLITVSANDFEISDANGRVFYTFIREAMRGTDSAYTGTPPTAAQIRQEIDSNSTQLAAILIDTGSTLDAKLDAIQAVTDNIPDSGALTSLAADVAAILVDTGTNIPATLSTILGHIDTEIADILVDTSTTLDAKLDAIQAVTDLIPDGGALTALLASIAAILTDTGTTLPAQITGLENLSQAEAQAAAAAALTAYDPPSRTEATADKDEILAAATNIETDTQDIQNRLPAALVGGKMDSDATSISGSVTAADNLEAGALGVVTGATIAGTLSITEASTDLVEATNDHYIGRVITFTSGPLNGQTTDITDYDGTTKVLTFTALTEAPGVGVSFIIT